jgi:hypothetical protein
LFENFPQSLLVIAPETPQAVVVGLDQARQPEQRKMFPAGRFELARGADAMEVAVEPDLQEQARRVGGTAFHSGGHEETQGRQIQLLDKLPQKTSRMIRRHPLFQRRGKKELLSVIGAMSRVIAYLTVYSTNAFKF